MNEPGLKESGGRVVRATHVEMQVKEGKQMLQFGLTLRRGLMPLLGLLLMTRLLPAPADPADDYIRAQMARRHIPGMTVAVALNGRIIKLRGYGLASLELNAPAKADTVYPLGSVSKQFTAVGVVLLTREGKVGLDDPISKYLSDLPSAWQAITVRQLLNQTSGVPEWNPDTDKDPLLKAYPLAEIVRRAAAKPLAFAPGTHYEYSNTNYSLLAGVIEKASGKPYGDFLQERLFHPLGMTATGIYDPQIVVRGRATGYDRAGGRLYNNLILFDPSYLAGSGGLQSTAGDLLRWQAALTAGKVLPPSVLSRMWTSPVLPGGAQTDYGMGWVSQTVNGHRLVWHNGAIPGATAFLGWFPADRLTVVILSNSFPLDGQDDAHPFLPMGQRLATFYVPALAPPRAAQSPTIERKS